MNLLFKFLLLSIPISIIFYGKPKLISNQNNKTENKLHSHKKDPENGSNKTIHKRSNKLIKTTNIKFTQDQNSTEQKSSKEIENTKLNSLNSVQADRFGFKINGKRKILRGGTLQWFRLPPSTWRDRLKRFKALGYNTVDIYISWNASEPEEGKFNFTNPNLSKFLDLCQELGLYVYFRPGPYITNEVDGGGIPSWLFTKTTKRAIKKDGKVNLRTEDPDYISYVQKYFSALNKIIKPYLITNGGPIILYALENEFDYFPLFEQAESFAIYKGKRERGKDRVNPKKYFTALKNLLINDGIDVPIATCPGRSKIESMGDVPGIIPLPNVYKNLGGDYPERVGYRLLTDMRKPGAYNEVYKNLPTGTTETVRDPVFLKRLIMGGMDAIFAFNIFGMIQEGKQNAIVMKSNPAMDKWSFTNFKLEQLKTLFIRPQVGYFHNVIDYGGAVSPSGIHRGSFYEIRRDNMFFNAVEHSLGQAEIPNRSGNFYGSNKKLTIYNYELGAIEKDDSFFFPREKRVHYWMEGSGGSRFINLVNQSGLNQEVPIRGINLEGYRFPKYTKLIVPSQEDEFNRQIGDNADNAMILLRNFDLENLGLIRHSSAELLTFKKFNGDFLLVLYGKDGLSGEISLNLGKETWTAEYQSSQIKVELNKTEFLDLSFNYQKDQFLYLKNKNGQKLKVVITTKSEAGKFWFIKNSGKDLLIKGVDYINSDSIKDSVDHLEFVIDLNENPKNLWALLPNNLNIDPTKEIKTKEAPKDIFHFEKSQKNLSLSKGLNLHSGKLKSDLAETESSFNTDSWTSWEGNPKPLEENGMLKGHAWYRTEFEASQNYLSNPFSNTALYVQHASDIVGIYVNGKYLTTVLPLGTEIESNSFDPSYQFPALKPYLKKGRNVIAFKTEIWGHGSFMFPRGQAIGTKLRIPSLGFDSLKGLYGSADIGNIMGVGGINLNKWSVRAGLGGDLKGFYKNDYDDSSWDTKELPLALKKGDVLWYRTAFKSNDFPNETDFHAPLALELKGNNVKATIYLNGKIIGRWLSEGDWISRGFWGLSVRDMWLNTDPDHFPVPIEILNKDGKENSLVLAVEDVSGPKEEPGELEEFKFIFAKENKGKVNNKIKMIKQIKSRIDFKLERK